MSIPRLEIRRAVKGDGMNRRALLAAMLCAASVAWGQGESPQPPMGGPGMTGPNGGQRQKMMEMHKQHLDAMKADVEKMKATLDQMKANVAKISDAGEKARWQSNVDLWTMMVGHMEHMMKEMDSLGPGMMGPGMMHHGGMGGPPPNPPDQKPQ